MAAPPYPQAVDPHSTEHIWILDALTGKRPLIVMGEGGGIRIDYDKEKCCYKISSTARGGSAAGGFMGEYDPAQNYSAGMSFTVSPYVPLVISGTTIQPGYYAVTPDSSVADSQSFGPWAGSLPANPATSGIDLDKLFFNPDATFPTFGSAPNDKLYARLVGKYC